MGTMRMFQLARAPAPESIGYTEGLSDISNLDSIAYWKKLHEHTRLIPIITSQKLIILMEISSKSIKTIENKLRNKISRQSLVTLPYSWSNSKVGQDPNPEPFDFPRLDCLQNRLSIRKMCSEMLLETRS